MSIAAFVADRMNRYLAGGMSAGAAAGFTRGELSAVYNGNHYGRGSAGEWRQTPPPEILDTATALKKAEAAITAFLSGATPAAEPDERGLVKSPQSVIEGPGMNAETEKAETHGKAPDGPPMAKETRQRGLERMAEYVRGRSA